MLFALREPELQVVQASANLESVLGFGRGLSPALTLGQPISALLGSAAGALIETALLSDDPAAENPLALLVRGRLYDALIHRSGEEEMLELEPSARLTGVETPLPLDRLLRGAIIHLQKVRSVDALCSIAAAQIRALSGFDRVMVYRFHDDSHGEVVAEAKAPGVESFFGFHYPAGDIPRQARQLYLLNSIRSIPDARYLPAPMVGRPELSGKMPAPLDMTHASLRAVSPVHLEYLANMGVAASMSVSLVCGGKLWGLLACHHGAPRFLPFAVRQACDVLGRLVSLEIDALEERGHREQRELLRGGEPALIESMKSSPAGWAAGLLASPALLLGVVGATGAAILDDNGIRTAGEVPPLDEIAALGAWLDAKPEPLFSSSALELELPRAASYRGAASGMIAMRVRRVVSHDLKNPLSVIQVVVHVARRQHLSGLAGKALDRLERASAQMSELIVNLLDLSKIEAGRFPVLLAYCQTAGLLAEARARQLPLAELKGVHLELSGEDLPIQADRDRMFQVLANLIENAIRYTPLGGVVRIGCRAAGAFASFSVEDAGPGLSEHALLHLFERYWQAPGAQPRQGSGLGLYIARGVVEAHGGRIWAESKRGGGSLFCFTIPCAVAQAA